MACLAAAAQARLLSVAEGTSGAFRENPAESRAPRKRSL